MHNHLTPKFSVITVTYNAEAVLEDTIQSVISQTYRHVEYIIVDGASKDKTLSITDRYKNHIAQVVSEPDKGLYDAMNKGIRLATGDYLCFLNAGDSFHEDDTLQQMVHTLTGSELPDVLYGETALVDKEEIGSEGNTGMNSDFLKHYLERLAQMQGADVKDLCQHTLCLSSDVNAAYDPTFGDVFEANNSCYINKGCVLTKYTGARGKSASNDASAETMAKVIGIMEENGVYWQAGELGAVDQGGGGTIAKYVAHMDIDVVDLGVPILSMHAPFELASKLDVYHTYKAFKAFYAS